MEDAIKITKRGKRTRSRKGGEKRGKRVTSTKEEKSVLTSPAKYEHKIPTKGGYNREKKQIVILIDLQKKEARRSREPTEEGGFSREERGKDGGMVPEAANFSIRQGKEVHEGASGDSDIKWDGPIDRWVSLPKERSYQSRRRGSGGGATLSGVKPSA